MKRKPRAHPKCKPSPASQLWVQSTSMNIPARLTMYEKELLYLGLDEDMSIRALTSNEDLVQWVMNNKNRYYVPEKLLRAIKTQSVWGEVEDEQAKQISRLSLEDLQAAIAANAETCMPEISTR